MFHRELLVYHSQFYKLILRVLFEDKNRKALTKG